MSNPSLVLYQTVNLTRMKNKIFLFLLVCKTAVGNSLPTATAGLLGQNPIDIISAYTKKKSFLCRRNLIVSMIKGKLCSYLKTLTDICKIQVIL